MIFTVAEIVSYLSHYMTLLPGDLIATGAPAEVGFGIKPVCLQEGDNICIHIDRLGYQNQKIVRE